MKIRLFQFEKQTKKEKYNNIVFEFNWLSFWEKTLCVQMNLNGLKLVRFIVHVNTSILCTINLAIVLYG